MKPKNTDTPQKADCPSATCSLPDWDSVEKKVNARKPITALEAFIHEHDDADPKRSSRFMAMLSDVLAENADVDAQIPAPTKPESITD